MSEELVNVADPRVMFIDGSVVEVLTNVRALVYPMVFDMRTAKGRRECAAVAARVARSKTMLDAVGKTIVSDWKSKSKAVDVQRKLLRDGLDEIKTAVRAPLTAFEASESRKLQMRRDQIDHVRILGSTVNSTGIHYSASELEKRIALLGDLPDPDDWFGDDIEEAQVVYRFASDCLAAGLVVRREEERKAEEARLAAVRAEEEAREKETAARVERETRAAVEKERKEASNRQAEGVARAKREAEKKHAEAMAADHQKAEEEKAAAIAAERGRIMEEQRIARVEAESVERARVRREKESATQLKGAVQSEIAKALLAEGLDAISADFVLDALVNNRIPHVEIRYE